MFRPAPLLTDQTADPSPVVAQLQDLKKSLQQDARDAVKEEKKMLLDEQHHLHELELQKLKQIAEAEEKKNRN